MLGAPEILDGDWPVGHRLGFLVRLAHATMVGGTRHPALDALKEIRWRSIGTVSMRAFTAAWVNGSANQASCWAGEMIAGLVAGLFTAF